MRLSFISAAVWTMTQCNRDAAGWEGKTGEGLEPHDFEGQRCWLPVYLLPSLMQVIPKPGRTNPSPETPTTWWAQTACLCSSTTSEEGDSWSVTECEIARRSRSRRREEGEREQRTLPAPSLPPLWRRGRGGRTRWHEGWTGSHLLWQRDDGREEHWGGRLEEPLPLPKLRSSSSSCWVFLFSLDEYYNFCFGAFKACKKWNMKLFKKTEMKLECMTGATDWPISHLDIFSFYKEKRGREKEEGVA